MYFASEASQKKGLFVEADTNLIYGKYALFVRAHTHFLHDIINAHKLFGERSDPQKNALFVSAHTFRSLHEIE